MNNEAPGLVRGGMSAGIRPLFHSRREIALIKDKSLTNGFGLLNQGYVLGTTEDGRVTPIPVDDGSVDAVDIARTRLVADAVDAASTIVVAEAEACRFAVGDSIIINNDTPAYDDVGKITAISDAVNGQVTITFDGTVNGSGFTIGNRAALSHKTAAADPFYAASCLLDKDVDTGTTAGTAAVPCSVVFRNAMVYTVYLTGMSEKSLADLGAVQDGVHTIF
jgi:hypothetical protein